MDTPEAAVAKLSFEAALLLRAQLAYDRWPLNMPTADLLQAQANWLAPDWLAPLVPGDRTCKPYIHRQRLALELRFNEHQLTCAQQVCVCTHRLSDCLELLIKPRAGMLSLCRGA